ncbi:hypothetical protein SELMODRAFT_136624 [Selaginella moellendorffii]|uniref:Peptidase S8/S53 domain-containing protein n=1 Tax=Selaginella moellendorffii TaxID=88036 RepID=D8TC12_SELML|nr:hypothetical protein SELMODRAFT_136624 [Selaginella moellendorffii]
MDASLWIWLLVSASSILLVHAEVYIALLDGEPVVHNKATTKIDSSSFVPLCSDQVQIYSSYLTAQHDFLLASTFGEESYTKLYSYSHLLHGFAVDITEEQAAKLKSTQGVKLVTKERIMRAVTTYTPKLLDLQHGAWPQLGGLKHAGEGIVIGIVDTGINPDHPSFAGNSKKPFRPVPHYKGKCVSGHGFPASACNGKVIGAQLFGKSVGYSNGDGTAFDADGHGSHVASTAGGNSGVPVVVDGVNYGLASGMAPRARIAVYKAVFGENGFVSDIIAAIEQAVRDGVDILNLSLGSENVTDATSVFMDPVEQALLSAVHAGVYVVQSAGNLGPAKSSVRSFSPWVMTVAAGNTGRHYKASVQLGNGKTIDGQVLSPPTPQRKSYPILMAEDSYVGSNYSEKSCVDSSRFNRSLVRGTIFVCQYSSLDSISIPNVLSVAHAAKNLSAAGFVMLLDPSSPYDGYMTSLYSLPIPGLVINTVNASSEFLDYYSSQTKKAVARINKNSVEYNRTVPIVAPYSSRGPNLLNNKEEPVDVLKPNILAPGEGIWGAWSPSAPVETVSLSLVFPGSKFVLCSGTSMAAPHIAGVAALIKQKHPSWTPAMISSSIMTTASVVDSKGGIIQAVTDQVVIGTPFDFGAGFVNVSAALDPGIVFDAGYQDYVSFMCSLNTTQAWKDAVKQATHSDCSIAMDAAYNLNSPSITVSSLKGNVVVRRRVSSVSDVAETYTAALVRPENVTADIVPATFTLGPHQEASFELRLGLTDGKLLADYVFGQLMLVGDRGHSARVFITVASK